MSPPVVLLTVALIALVVLIVGAPLMPARGPHGQERHGQTDPPVDPQLDVAREDVEAEREAKYREIRDAELDYRTGKLSEEDYAAVDGTLRAQALEILDRLDALEGSDLTRERESTDPGD